VAAPAPRRSIAAALALLGMSAGAGTVARAQEAAPRAPAVEPAWVTPGEVVTAMLAAARVGPRDVVYDLGCGDGRIVIAAARRHGARAVCVELDPGRVAEARRSAAAAGVASRVRFVQGDLFEAEIGGATVVTLYLPPELNERLRPKLIRELRPGTRVVSHEFDIGGGTWRPDSVAEVRGAGGVTHFVRLWVMPADVAGSWEVTVGGAEAGGPRAPLRVHLSQRYQQVRGTAETGGRTMPLRNAHLRGNRLAFGIGGAPGVRRSGLEFSGRVSGDSASGTVTDTRRGTRERWSARRESRVVSRPEPGRESAPGWRRRSGDAGAPRDTARGETPARTPDVSFVPTPPEVVARMLDVARIGRRDVVYDLGCGDGRIVIAAARRRGARGVCVDIDPDRIAESRRNADTAGVTHRITFREGDLFDLDLRAATVVMLYLTVPLNERLRPKLFRELRPGTRVVSHRFDMGDWEPDSVVRVRGYAGGVSPVYYWVMPADAAGRWAVTVEGDGASGDRYRLRVRQRYQQLRGTAESGGRRVALTAARLDGNRIGFTLTDTLGGRPLALRFAGWVSGRTAAGTVAVPGERRPRAWRAERE
jgi:predicted RNA methylase